MGGGVSRGADIAHSRAQGNSGDKLLQDSRNIAAGIRSGRTVSRQPRKESAVLMSVPGVWDAVTPPMFPCVCDGITFEREGTRIGRRVRLGYWRPFAEFDSVVFGPLRNGSSRRFSLGDTKHLTPIEATIVSRVDLHGCPILSPRIYESR